MQRLKIALIALLLLCPPAFAEDIPASKASIQELIEITQSKKMFNDVMVKAEDISKQIGEQALAGKQPDETQRQIMQEMRTKLHAVLNEAVTWSAMEPIIIDVYSKTFTQKEIEGILVFYKSEAGQAVLAKMPLVMQNMLQVMQQRMTVIMPKIQEIQRETIAKLTKTQKHSK